MRDITGAPAYQYVIDKESDMYSKIVDADQKNYLVSISCGKTDLEKQAARDLGLVTAHSYSIIECQTVTDGDKNVQLLKIRNPWGSFEWKGDWSDTSDKWTDATKD